MNIITILIAILAFGVIVFIHELGHFLFAKKQVLEFMNLLLVWDRKYIALKKVKPYIA
nr:site-2 protease family protein [Paraclostridium sp. AKS81]